MQDSNFLSSHCCVHGGRIEILLRMVDIIVFMMVECVCERDNCLQVTADAMRSQLEAHTRASNVLVGNIRMLENKVAEAMSKKETLKARAITAQVTVFHF